MNAYLNQLNHMSDTVRGGIGAIARDRLNRTALGLEEAKLDNSLAQQEREYNDPTRRLQRENSQAELDRLNAPVGFTDLAPTERSRMHFVWQPDPDAAGMKNTSFTSTSGAMGNRTASRGGMAAEDERAWPSVPGGQPGQKIAPMLITKVEDLYGAKLDTRPDSQTRGLLVKADGTPLTRREFEGRREQYNRLLTANTSAFKLVRDRGEDLEDEIEDIQARLAGGGGNKAQLTQVLAKKQGQLKGVQDWQNNPQQQMATLREQYDNLVAWGDPEAMKGAERVAGQIEKLQTRIKDAEEKAYTRAKDERDYNLRLAEVQGKAGQQKLAALKERINLATSMLKPYTRSDSEAAAWAVFQSGGAEAVAGMQPADQRMVIQVALDTANDANQPQITRDLARQLIMDLQSYGAIPTQQGGTPNLNQQGQGVQLASAHQATQPGQGSGLPPSITNALMGSPGKALRIRDGAGQERILIYRNGQVDELSQAEAQAMGQAQADRSRGASGSWDQPSQPAGAQSGQGSQARFDANLGHTAERLRQQSPITQGMEDAAAHLWQLAVAANNGIYNKTIGAAAEVLRDFQDWAKNRSPTARRLQGRDAVRQYLAENPDKVELLARNGR